MNVNKLVNNFELWEKGLETNNTEVWPLEKSRKQNFGLYMTRKKYLTGNNYYYTSPVYHIWIENEHITTMSYKEAYDIYSKRMRVND